MNNPPQAPFPSIPVIHREHYVNRKLTREFIGEIIDRMLSPYCHNLQCDVNQFIQHIAYNEGLGPYFKEYYRHLLKKLFIYFKHLQFESSDLDPVLFMELRMLKFFDGNKGNCIFNKFGLLSNEEFYNPGEDDTVFTFVFNELKVLSDFIGNCPIGKDVLMPVLIHTDGEKSGHRNLLVINKATKTVSIVEPNYRPNMGWEFKGKYFGYKKFFEPLGFNVVYKQIECLKNHGGMCTLLSTLGYYFPSKFDYNFVRQKFIDYLEWEINNIKSGVLSFGKKVKKKFKLRLSYA